MHSTCFADKRIKILELLSQGCIGVVHTIAYRVVVTPQNREHFGVLEIDHSHDPIIEPNPHKPTLRVKCKVPNWVLAAHDELLEFARGKVETANGIVL